MLKNILFTTLFVCNFYSAQKIYVKYLNVRSNIATVGEELYIDGKKVLSRQDSLVNFSRQSQDNGGLSVIKKGGSKQASYFISSISDAKVRDLFFTSYLNNGIDNYFIHDVVPQPNWIIDKNSSRKIAGYKCYKATTNFRGSNVTAYYAPDLPYSTGPFKFYGLPGLILDIRVDNKSYDIWRAEVVEVETKKKVVMTPKFENYLKATIQDFMLLKEKNYQNNSREINNAVISKTGGTVLNAKTSRFGVEKKFEWEE